ncbi:hypothetical protein FNV43_RR12956 [Rhamnella rubrinervis]|uniref:Uncharacterized protein n=1 Tax=Rhamnella rubrinervis TaxID=2594499 RepID=A0A8K0H082_9ROSA|nr:hypothetical protein FNV43_RR12956 [Rhamnella rubrinervis]
MSSLYIEVFEISNFDFCIKVLRNVSVGFCTKLLRDRAEETKIAAEDAMQEMMAMKGKIEKIKSERKKMLEDIETLKNKISLEDCHGFYRFGSVGGVGGDGIFGSFLLIFSPRNLSSPSHFLYVDDVLLFCRGTHQNMSGIFVTLYLYDSLSGQILPFEIAGGCFQPQLKALDLVGSLFQKVMVISLSSQIFNLWNTAIVIAFSAIWFIRNQRHFEVWGCRYGVLGSSDYSYGLKVNIDGAADGCSGPGGCGDYFVISMGFTKGSFVVLLDSCYAFESELLGGVEGNTISFQASAFFFVSLVDGVFLTIVLLCII